MHISGKYLGKLPARIEIDRVLIDLPYFIVFIRIKAKFNIIINEYKIEDYRRMYSVVFSMLPFYPDF